MFPKEFRDRVPVELLEALDKSAVTSVRYNPCKSVERFTGDGVAWCNDGVYLDERPVFTTDPMFHAGAYYVQEASSMFVGWMVERLGIAQARILDLCAAPGGKSTQLAAYASVLVSNEVIRSRAKILNDNVQRWGTGNIAVTNNDPKQFGERAVSFFDVMVIDTPCSGEGMFRKDLAAREEWSPEAVELCAARSRRIVSDSWSALRDGGVLIYSTCTFNEQENERNAEWICQELGGEVIEFDNVPEGVVTHGAGYRFMPNLVRGEGFYAVAIRKLGDEQRAEYFIKKGKNSMIVASNEEQIEASRWVGEPLHFASGGDNLYGFTDQMWEVIEFLRANFNLLYSGVMMGEMIRGVLKPAHSLATYYNVVCQNRAELPLDVAVEYLRRGVVSAEFCERDGVALATYGGMPLGWLKRIGTRTNNQYPQHLRILHF